MLGDAKVDEHGNVNIMKDCSVMYLDKDGEDREINISSAICFLRGKAYEALENRAQARQWIKFNVKINDATGSIPATIFAEKAEELYNITAAEIINNTTDGDLSVQMIQKSSAPKNSAIMLRASMYTYGVISQCVFSAYSIITLFGMTGVGAEFRV